MMNFRAQALNVLAVLVLLMMFGPAIPTAQADNEPGHHAQLDPHAGHGHTDALHFLHPLVTESPLPENEARLEFSFENLAGTEGVASTLTATIEIAPVRWFSVEMSAPVTHLDPETEKSQTRLGNIGLGFKFACFEFEEQGILLATGLEFGLPTGNEERGVGNDHVLEVEPWFGFGFKCDRFEWVSRIGAGLPMNENADREADVELEWATSLLLHVIDDRLALLVELDGHSVFGGDEDGFNNVSITPGVRLFPFENPDVSLGMGVRLPLTDDRESHAQGILTVFFHF